MSDAVIEIKMWDSGLCHWDCTLHDGDGCRGDFAEMVSCRGSFRPTDKCPGPGFYRLVKVEE